MRNVGMIERSQHFGFALEASHSLRITGVSIGENLERHIALQLGVASAINLAHAACAQRGENLVSAKRETRWQTISVGYRAYELRIRAAQQRFHFAAQFRIF